MKILLIRSYLLLFSLLFFTNVDAQTTTSKNNNSLITQKRNLINYSALSLNIPASIEVSQSADYAFSITGKQELLDQFITEIKDGELVITTKDKKWKWSGDQTIRISISLPKINSMEINGSGHIAAISVMSTEKLSLLINGSGHISTMSINVTALNAEINGSGSILELSGNADQITMAVNGSGNIKAGRLQSKRSTIAISGSGNIDAGSIASLDVNIAGSGNVSYHGNPENVKKRISGSGTVSQE